MAWTWPWAKHPAGMAAPRPQPAGSSTEQPTERKAAGGFVAPHMAGTAAWTKPGYGGLAREGYMRNPVVHCAVRLIAQTAAAFPWLLYEGVTELETHPLLDLLTRPNPRQAGASFLETLYTHLLIGGNAYVERVDGSAGPAELYLLRPDGVSVSCAADGWPEALEQRDGGRSRRIGLTGVRAEALHLRLTQRYQ